MNSVNGDRDFIAAVRQFIADAWRGEATSVMVRGRTPRSVEQSVRAWFAAVVARGWSTPGWPVAAGGQGWSVRQCHLWRSELARAGAPLPDPVGIDLVGPLLLDHGSPEQRARYLPPIRDLHERWVLSGLGGVADHPPAWPTIAAEPTMGGYKVSGATAVVTGLVGAHRLLLLAPLVPDPAVPEESGSPGAGTRAGTRAGISRADLVLLAVDLALPGVRIEPLALLDGRSGAGRVIFDGVTVPVRDRIGSEGSGAVLARDLDHRSEHRLEPVAGLAGLLQDLGAVATTQPDGPGVVADDPGFSRSFRELEVELAGLLALEARWLVQPGLAAAGQLAGTAVPSVADLGSILRLRSARLGERIGELFVEAFGYYSLPQPDPVAIDNEGPIGHYHAMAVVRDRLARYLEHPGMGSAEGAAQGAAGFLRDRMAQRLLG